MNRVTPPRLTRHAASSPGICAHARTRAGAAAAGGALLAALALALGGCDSSPAVGDTPPTGPPRSAATAPDWPFWPRRVRIHPLTRLVEEADGETYVEARIEFLDARSDGTKASGSLELGLFDERRGPDNRRVIDFWQSDLADPQMNAARFDPVTRTYLFKLSVPADVFELGPVLYVRHDSDDGRTMLDRMELRTDS
jgi:hypothetical protein